MDRPRLLRELLQPRCYRHPVDRIEHLQTHISDVFLTGPYAYKLKKPLELGFLDFSTLEKRRYFCEEELRLNRRLAPDLYLAVVPIAGEVDDPQVDGSGPVLDYAVQMRQFDQRGLLERALAEGALTERHVDELARMVAQFHAGLLPASGQSEYGTPSAITAAAMQNFEQLTPLLDNAADRTQLEQLRQWTIGQHATLAPLFAQRGEQGFVRECHGDLHLSNMVLIDARVRIFDCIEFNPALRWIDVMNEIAFVAMDFMQRGSPRFAYRFLDGYLQLTGDYEGVPLLRYYMIYRALVRAKVAALRAHQQDVEPATRRSLIERCKAHVRLAAALRSPRPPALIIMHGLSGSGKTTVSQVLLETLGGIRVRSDVERKRLQGLSADTPAAGAPDTGLYTPAFSEATYQRLGTLASSIVAGEFSAVLDAAFLRRAQRDDMRELARTLRVHFRIADVQAEAEVLRRRVTQRAAAAHDASDATIEVLDHQMRTREALTPDELALTIAFDTGHEDESALAAKAVQFIHSAQRN
jgi:aminoglycoside phosphotransferase family enzyme/predicted kinase